MSRVHVLRYKAGFSLIEAILAVAILAASFMGLSQVLSNTTLHNVNLDISTSAVLLAQGEMEEIKAKTFSSVANVATTSFGGNFSDYRYRVDTGYVNSADLDTPVAGPTDYKRIVVTVTHTSWPGQIVIYDLKANAWEVD